ncbi:MAG: hypothetical protein ACAH88_12050, partial [Roseimicrobium sp.]
MSATTTGYWQIFEVEAFFSAASGESWHQRTMPADHSLQGFTLYVDENSHHRDEAARYTQGVYVTYEEALTVAKGMLERDLQASLGKGMSGKEWLEAYF